LQVFDAHYIGGRITLGMRSEDSFRKRLFRVEPVDERVGFLDQLGQFPGAIQVHAGIAIGIDADQRFVIVEEIDKIGHSCAQ
jgi:hypothetical protein